MSIISNLLSMFTGGSAKETPVVAASSQSHADCLIYATPMREGGQFRLAGRIEKEVGGEMLVRTFIRADMFSSADDATEGTFRKARQIIDQTGASLFADGAASRQV